MWNDVLYKIFLYYFVFRNSIRYYSILNLFFNTHTKGAPSKHLMWLWHTVSDLCKWMKKLLTWTALFRKQLFSPGAFHNPFVVWKIPESLESSLECCGLRSPTYVSCVAAILWLTQSPFCKRDTSWFNCNKKEYS